MMSDSVLYSFLGALSLFLLVGLMSVRHRQKSAEDYLLASRDISPAFAGLSGAASTASGFGFTGIIGFGYVMGFAGWWFIAGIIFGSLAGLYFTARRFRVYSQKYKAFSYTEFLSAGLGSTTRWFPALLGIVSIVAVTLYATAQMTAGSKALHVLFDWDYSAGAILAAIMVLLYCWAGGIRASIWTDVAQIIVMYLAMALLMVVSLSHIGGISGLYHALQEIDPQLVSFFPKNNPFGPLMFILGCFTVGFSFIGFPHVMVRFMTLRKAKDTQKALMWYEGSYALFYVTAYIVALCTRVLVPDAADFDKELALPELAQSMLSPVLVGVILAGIFAGTTSTADSLILCSTANLSRDIFHRYKESYGFMKLSTLLVTLSSLLIALYGSQSVFDLVLFVIAIMGAGFAPLLIIRVMNWPVNEMQASIMIICGLAATVYWRVYGYHVHVFDSLPCIVVAFFVYGLLLILQRGFKSRESLANS